MLSPVYELRFVCHHVPLKGGSRSCLQLSDHDLVGYLVIALVFSSSHLGRSSFSRLHSNSWGNCCIFWGNFLCYCLFIEFIIDFASCLLQRNYVLLVLDSHEGLLKSLSVLFKLLLLVIVNDRCLTVSCYGLLVAKVMRVGMKDYVFFLHQVTALRLEYCVIFKDVL